MSSSEVPESQYIVFFIFLLQLILEMLEAVDTVCPCSRELHSAWLLVPLLPQVPSRYRSPPALCTMKREIPVPVCDGNGLRDAAPGQNLRKAVNELV